MPPTPSTGEPLYTVLTPQVIATRADETGRFVEGYLVSFRTRSGHSGQIFVPLARYTVPVVQAMLRAAASALEDVSSLTG